MAVAQWLGIAPENAGNHVQRLPTAGANSALNLLHSSIVFDLHQIAEIRAELPGDNGRATEKIKHAKSRQLHVPEVLRVRSALRAQRRARPDLLHRARIRGMDAVAEAFRNERGGKHGAVVETLAILRDRFADDEKTEGWRPSSGRQVRAG